MRYELQLEIARSRNRVLELFLDPNCLGEWQPDFIRYEFLEGETSRSVGAKSRQWHHMGSREVEVLETITVHDYPERFAATYEAEGVWTLVENRFIASTLETTQWIVLSDVRCSGVAAWLAFFAPWLFKRQTRTFMERFRTYVESSPPSR